MIDRDDIAIPSKIRHFVAALHHGWGL